jgi:cell division control protein CDC15
MNKYQIDYTNMLGKGAMAKVYLGYYVTGESDTSTMFAVKEIPTNSSMIATDALLQEINLLRKITHPYILKYIDAKKTPSSLFLFIEYCNKGTLEDFVLEHPEGLS